MGGASPPLSMPNALPKFAQILQKYRRKKCPCRAISPLRTSNLKSCGLVFRLLLLDRIVLTMLGFINRAIECFIRDTYGDAVWARVTIGAGLSVDRFEPMLHYDSAVADSLILAVASVLDRPRDSILEDIGIYLVSHPHTERLRRLLRFGGVDFIAFLHSLEDLPERGRLALADLDLPELTLLDLGNGVFRLQCRMPISGIGHVLVGLLRAMADDYGALALIDYEGQQRGADIVSVHLLDYRFTKGRAFDLAALMLK